MNIFVRLFFLVYFTDKIISKFKDGHYFLDIEVIFYFYILILMALIIFEYYGFSLYLSELPSTATQWGILTSFSPNSPSVISTEA